MVEMIINGFNVKGSLEEIRQLLNNKEVVKVKKDYQRNSTDRTSKIIIKFLEEHPSTQFTGKEVKVNAGIKNPYPRLFTLFKNGVISRTVERPFKYFKQSYPCSSYYVNEKAKGVKE